jgi:uncharacterized protein
MKTARQGSLVVARLERGERLPDDLLRLYQELDITGAFVHVGIGMITDVELGYFTGPGQYARKRFTGAYECLAIQGSICLYDGQPTAHLHAMLANEDYSVFGGHLIAAEVALTLELELSTYSLPVRMYRRVEEASGLPGLLVE